MVPMTSRSRDEEAARRPITVRSSGAEPDRAAPETATLPGRVPEAGRRLAVATLLRLQRTAGNRAVQRLVRPEPRRPAAGAPDHDGGGAGPDETVAPAEAKAGGGGHGAGEVGLAGTAPTPPAAPPAGGGEPAPAAPAEARSGEGGDAAPLAPAETTRSEEHTSELQ